jgi:hypothetical protein
MSRKASGTRYTLDRSHRVAVITHPEGRFRRLLTGRLSADSQNRLVFQPDFQTAAEDDASQPITLEGRWSIRPDQALLYTLRASPGLPRQALRISGRLIRAQADSLTFSYGRIDVFGNRANQEVTLLGRWQADQANRLTFMVARSQGNQDRLTLQGAWEVGQKHELLYRQSRLEQGRLDGQEAHLLRFSGVWDAPSVGRLVYRMDGGSQSLFDFRAAVQTPSLRAAEGRMAWQVGVGVTRHRTAWTRVVLFGTWKLNTDRSLSLEVPYADGRAQSIRFEGSFAWGGRNTVTVELADGQRRPFGMALTLTRQLSAAASLFLSVRKDGDQTLAATGVQVRF